MNGSTPVAPSALPLKGAPLAARQSRFRGGRWVATRNSMEYSMAAITASMVAELRAKTDAPMMECKKALTEADGDSARAEEILRVKLGSKAEIGRASCRERVYSSV